MTSSTRDLIALTAEYLYEAFRRYDAEFNAITARAAQRFAEQDWPGARLDLGQRMDLWEQAVSRAVAGTARRLADQAHSRHCWHHVKEYFGVRVESFADAEFARTFFTSVARRTFNNSGVDPLIEYVLDLEPDIPQGGSLPTRVHINWGDLNRLFTDVLQQVELGVEFVDREASVRQVCEAVRELSRTCYRGPRTLLRVEFITPVFYQSSQAFLVGRIDGEHWSGPIAIGFQHGESGLVVERVYMSEAAFSVLFGFTRAYFFVNLEIVGSVVRFLHRLLPDKAVDELYSVLGRVRQGKTERYRYLARHLKYSQDRFVNAPGDRGMVMVVFTLPSYPLVFKVMRDDFGFSKTVTHQEVINKYRLVARHDRAGRLIDTQAFRHIEFPVERFDEALLAELLDEASQSVRLRGNRLVIDLVYMERKLRPLNLFLREASDLRARAAVRDYGQAIKDMAAANIFPGDMLLKNFGVTRHGRVIFYDFDEITLITECRFRHLPQARNDEDLLCGDNWFHVGRNDVFPEQFAHFLGLRTEMKSEFLHHHADLLLPEFWHQSQSLHTIK